MPIAYFPSSGGPTPGAGPTLPVILPTVPLDPAPPTPFVKGHVVAIENMGTAYIILCGALPVDRPDLFFGVMEIPVPAGGSTVVSGRGSLVTPFVQGAIPLAPNQDIYLSTTPGEVTQTAPSGPGVTIVRMGFAINTTQAILTTDPRYVYP